MYLHKMYEKLDKRQANKETTNANACVCGYVLMYYIYILKVVNVYNSGTLQLSINSSLVISKTLSSKNEYKQ